MFHHVYADLVMLVKSEKLQKPAYDMSKHYQELSLFLATVEKDPRIMMDKSTRVFPSERHLYGEEVKLNHRLHSKCQLIEECLFRRNENDEEFLFPLLAAGATEMHKKLCQYARNYLPEGKYWNPNSEVAAVLKKLKPNNDICESTLGLNDYLTTALPNMFQITRSNLVEVKKIKPSNGTMNYLYRTNSRLQTWLLNNEMKHLSNTKMLNKRYLTVSAKTQLVRTIFKKNFFFTQHC